jgi:YggT family protein
MRAKGYIGQTLNWQTAPQKPARPRGQQAPLRHALANADPPPYLWAGFEQRKAPAMLSIIQILLMLISVAKFIIIAHIIMSWLINFGVLNMHQPLVAQIWRGLNQLLEPIYGPIRRRLPDMGGLDLAPLIVILGLFAAEILIRNNAVYFI